MVYLFVFKHLIFNADEYHTIKIMKLIIMKLKLYTNKIMKHFHVKLIVKATLWIERVKL